MFRWQKSVGTIPVERTRNEDRAFAEDCTDWQFKLRREEKKCPGRNKKEKWTFGEKSKNICNQYSIVRWQDWSHCHVITESLGWPWARVNKVVKVLWLADVTTKFTDFVIINIFHFRVRTLRKLFLRRVYFWAQVILSAISLLW